jgi:hypothetical protein
MPVSAFVSVLIMQYRPDWTRAAVAEAVIVGALVMKRLENENLPGAETVTLTAELAAAVQAPLVGGDWTVQVGVVPIRVLTVPTVRSRETGLLALQLPVETVCPASFPKTPASAPLSAAR